MNIKIQCACGAKYAFDIEPVNGQMPIAINCPRCNTSGVEAANAEMARQLEALSAQEAPAPSFCSRHQDEPPTSACFVCGKPICLKCMKQFGYLCSAQCRQKADLEGIDVPVCKVQKAVQMDRSRSSLKGVMALSAALLFSLLGLWVWYTYFARQPKPVYSLVIPKIETPRGVSRKPFDFYRLIGPNQLLWLKDKKLTLFDVTKKAELWSVPLPKPAEKPVDNGKNTRLAGMFAKAKSVLSNSEDYYFAYPNLIATSNDLWLWFSDRLYRFDRQSGNMTAPITNEIAHITRGENVLLVASKGPAGRKLLTQISLLDGSMNEEDFKSAPLASEPPTNSRSPKATAAKALQASFFKNRTSATPPAPQKTNDLSDLESDWAFYDSAHQCVPAGENVAQFRSELLEENLIQHETVNAKKPKEDIVDSGNATVGRSMEAAAQMAAPAAKYEFEDLSRYRVTVTRRLCSELPGWTNEVIGRPNFFPLKTMDIVTAGTNVYALDKNNKKLWEARTSYPVASRYSFDESEHSPCLETKDALYIADAGTLTRFEPATGNVLWNLYSVGISRIQEDAHGALYVCTTTASLNALKGEPDPNHAVPILLKIDCKTGQIRWQSERPATDCFLSGKFVYTLHLSQMVEYLNLDEGAKQLFTLSLIDPGTGKTIWRYFQYNQHPLKVEVQDNWFLAYFEEKLVVLKFWSL